MRALKSRTTYSTVDVSLQEDRGGAGASHGGGGTGAALHDATAISRRSSTSACARSASCCRCSCSPERPDSAAERSLAAPPRARSCSKQPHALASCGVMGDGEDTARLFARVPLFADLSETDLRELAQVAVPRSYEPGELVFREGDTGDTCFVVRSGSGRVTRRHSDGRVITLTELRRGRVLR